MQTFLSLKAGDQKHKNKIEKIETELGCIP
jgi:hypothetical protein